MQRQAVLRHEALQRQRVCDLEAGRNSLHRRYAVTRDGATRAELMASYDGFACSLALKYRNREPIDDLLQVARIGLLHAIDRFDPGLDRPFLHYARMTIVGELKRHLRDKTWAMRVTRSLQEDYLNVVRAVDELSAGRSGSPSMTELAEHCGLSVDRVVEAMDVRLGRQVLSLDFPTPGRAGDGATIDPGHDDLGFHQFENRELLASLLTRLSQRDRRIVEMRFIDDMTQAEIGLALGISQMSVSRVLARTLGRLRVWARTAVA